MSASHDPNNKKGNLLQVINPQAPSGDNVEGWSRHIREDTGRWERRCINWTPGRSGTLVVLWEIGPISSGHVRGLMIGTFASLHIPMGGWFEGGEPFRCWHAIFGSLADEAYWQDTISRLITVPSQISMKLPSF